MSAFHHCASLNGAIRVVKVYKTDADAWPISADIAEEAVNGSAVKENLESSFLASST